MSRNLSEIFYSLTTGDKSIIDNDPEICVSDSIQDRFWIKEITDI